MAAAALVSFAWRAALRSSGALRSRVLSIALLMDSAQFGSNSYKLVLPTSKKIVAFELQRALLYCRLVSDQRGRQFESRASNEISSFFCTGFVG
jgi:hypothetical protein